MPAGPSRERLRAAFAGLLVAAAASGLGSENVTLTTSYPSPAGIYRNLTTTQETVIARDSGRVGVGTAQPKAGLDIRRIVNLEDPVNAAAVLYFPATQKTGIAAGLYIRADDEPSSYENATERLFVGAGGNVNVGQGSAPLPAAPNGSSGNLSVNDVFLRSSGRWASQAGVQKVCATLHWGSWYEAMAVPQSWTVENCRQFANEPWPGARYRVGCLLPNGFSWGGYVVGAAQAPVPPTNCGW